MDEFSVDRPHSKRHDRMRTSSFASSHSLRPASAASNNRPHAHDSTRSSLRHRTSMTSMNSYAGSEFDGTEILSPVPRRHLIQTSQSRHWLQTPSHSPTDSRPVSPVTSKLRASRHISFSSLLEKQTPRSEEEPSMGKRWIRWMHKEGARGWVIPSAIAGAALVKWCIGLGSYSGQGTPPMFGDYEAQRHWMELTVHLPILRWYTYDPQYWGLDYPPLTAYVSWLCGIIGSWLNPSWFALHKSRGIEDEASKIFMRASVLVLDTLVYVPALVMFVRTWQATRSQRTQELALLTLLMQPALFLIDFGHFQYNSVMLGLTLLAVNFFAIERDLLGASCFVLSLGFKQMALYYAPAIGSYLLAKCLYLGPGKGGRLFIQLALVTSATFLLLLFPFLPPLAPFSSTLHLIRRVFPFHRGLFEDKVANFWCASNVVFKWRNWVSGSTLVRLSALLTAVGFLPGVMGLLQAGFKMYRLQAKEQKSAAGTVLVTTPILPLLPYALLTSSMSFFLFSFQVHEKTILLPLLPMSLLFSGSSPESSAYAWGALVTNVAVFSMWPLLRREGLGVQYIAVLLLWNRLVGYNPFHLPKNTFVQLLSLAVYATAGILHVLELFIPPPSRYPDLFPVLNVLISTPVFVLVWLWSIKCGVQVLWAMGGLGSSTPRRGASVHSTAVRGNGDMPGGKADDGAAILRSRSTGVGPDSAKGVPREMGARAMSFGSAQGRRRISLQTLEEKNSSG